MRKFLWVVAVGALVLAMAAPVMAFEFQFKGEWRVRFYDYSNITFDSDNNSRDVSPMSLGQVVPGQPQVSPTKIRGNPRGIQIRVRPWFQVSDDNGNIQAVWRAEYGDTQFGAGGGANGTAFGTNGPAISIATPSNARVGNGAGGSIGADGVALETKWAYIDFAMPFNVPLRVRAGIQPWYLPKGLIIDDDIAGVRAYGSIKPVSYEAFFYRAGRGNPAPLATDTTRDNANDYFGAKVDVAIAPWLNPGLYYVYGDNRLQCATVATTCNDRVRPQHFVGFTATGKVGIVDYDLDFVYGQTKGGITGSHGTYYINGVPVSVRVGTVDVPIASVLGTQPVTVKGWALDGGVHIPVGPVKVNLLGAIATGDKQDGGDSEAFPLGPGPSWSGAGGQYELIGEGGAFDVWSMTQNNPTNLWMLGATLEYVPVKPLWIKLAYGYAGFTRKNGNCGVDFNPTTGLVNPTSPILPGGSCFGPIYIGKPSSPIAGKGGLGHELHLRADYTIWTGFKVQGLVGWLFPSAGDTAGKYILQMLYSF